MSILDILDELASDNSRLNKIAVLKNHKDNELLQKVFVAALNPYINFYQKKIPVYTVGKCFPDTSLEEAIDQLYSELVSRKVTGTKAINILREILQSSAVKDATVIERIIGRDLKCGVDTSTVNKVWSGLIPTFDVMLSHKDISGITFPAYAQTKMDGARCHLHYDGETVTAFARSGKQFKLHNAFLPTAVDMMEPQETWDGEIIFIDPVTGKFLDRKTSNGLANKANKGTLTENEAKYAMFVAWDIVDFTGAIPYEDRFNTLTERFNISQSLDNRFRLVKSIIVNNLEEAQEFYDGERELKEEGAILKNMKAPWQPKRTKDLGKMKAEEEADLIVVGYKLGKVRSKFEGLLGSLECETSDGIVEVNVSGMDEETRFSEKDLDNWIKTIITVRYNEVIKDKKTGKYSLFLPRFIERRWDKNVANSFEELK